MSSSVKHRSKKAPGPTTTRPSSPLSPAEQVPSISSATLNGVLLDCSQARCACLLTKDRLTGLTTLLFSLPSGFVPDPLYKSLLKSCPILALSTSPVPSTQKRPLCPCLARFCHINSALDYLKLFLLLISFTFHHQLNILPLLHQRPGLRKRLLGICDSQAVL